MIKLIHITVGTLLMAAVLCGPPAAARAHTGAAGDVPATVSGARLEKHGKLTRRAAARKRAGSYKLSSSRKTARSTRLKNAASVAKNARHKETGTRNLSTALGIREGRLPWPVDSRKISMHFGLQNYMDNDNVKIDNLGIVIEAGKGAIVKAVMDGVVDDVMDIGGGVAVLIKHDNYFFIYSDLSAAIVTKGQQVTAGAILGEVGEEGQLDFRLYDTHDIWLDPEKWLESAALKKL